MSWGLLIAQQGNKTCFTNFKQRPVPVSQGLCQRKLLNFTTLGKLGK